MSFEKQEQLAPYRNRNEPYNKLGRAPFDHSDIHMYACLRI